MFFGILGAVEVRRADGDPVAVGGPRLRALVALLALNAGRVVAVDALVDGLYGERPPAGAAHALQSQVSRLRRGLRGGAGTAGVLEFHPAGYRLAVDPDAVDAHRFARLAEQGRRALAGGDPHQAGALLRQALRLWRGPALADVAAAPFAPAQITRLEQAWLAAAEDRVEAELAVGEHLAVLPELHQLVAEHPLRERLRGQLMRALAAAGRRAEAFAVFEDARQALAEEFGVDPSADLAGVHLALLRAEPATPPSPPAPPPPPTGAVRGLPAEFTSFVGRTADLARVGALLRRSRLVTLTGPGGAGKTRLAVRAGEQAAGEWPDGEVCFVELAPVTDAAEVAQTLLGALGLRSAGLLGAGDPGQPDDPVTRLVAGLAHRRLLLVLDNCEHVVAHVARLTRRLLTACPELRVLATSREALGITGESLCPVPPLPLPAPGAEAALVAAAPAVRLFADRAAAVCPDFTVHPGNAAVVSRVCAALDGLPLAIELAAARLRSLDLAEIAARLDDRFRLLSRGDRTGAARHRTLRAVVEWSWDLLDPSEQVLARRLAVFAGGASTTAVERVCGNVAPEHGGDLDGPLAGLVEKSLVEAVGGRYRMLETVRAFCAERLAAAGEEDRLRRAHAAHVLDLARTADPLLRSAAQLDWLARLDAERADLHAALRWAVRADPPLALRLVAALTWYWWLRGQRGHAAPLATELLAALGDDPPAELAEEYVLCALTALGGTPRPGLAGHLATARALLAARAWRFRHPHTLLLWVVAGETVDTDQVDWPAMFDADAWAHAFVRMGTGLQLLLDGRLADAERELVAALDSFRSVGDRWGIANALDQLAGITRWRGDRDRFFALVAEAIELIELIGVTEDTAELLCRRADGLLDGGEVGAARADYERAAELARRAGATHMAADAHRGLGEIARLRGDHTEADRLHRMALAECAGESVTALAARSRVCTALGRLAEVDRDGTAARRWHGQALAAALHHRNLPAVAAAVEGMAGAAVAEGDGERAALLVGAAARLRGAPASGADVASTAARGRDLIGSPAWAAAVDRGRALSAAQALELACAQW
uniref:BTAD domain-containing putative transcriptional regulator n=1 Tax=Goodfellowiella coeruleoviolacea TaxID=334858 RepID=UPI0038990012